MKRGILVLGMISMLSTALWSIGSSESTVLDNWEYSGIRSLKIEKGSVFHIEVAGGSNKRLEARIHLPDDDSVVVHHSKRGSELLVWTEWKSGFTSWGGSALQMEFRVPEGIDLDIETSTGSVAIEGCNGEKNVRTSTGGITVKNSSGDIRGGSSTGHHEYEEVKGDLQIESSTGKQEFRSIRGDITAVSTTGGIRVSDHEGALDLHSSTGSQGGEDIRLTGDSAFHTSTGSIDFDFLNPIEAFTFDLRSSTGRIQVLGSDARGRVKVGDGPIEVKAASSTGNQSYR